MAEQNIQSSDGSLFAKLGCVVPECTGTKTSLFCCQNNDFKKWCWQFLFHFRRCQKNATKEIFNNNKTWTQFSMTDSSIQAKCPVKWQDSWRLALSTNCSSNECDQTKNSMGGSICTCLNFSLNILKDVAIWTVLEVFWFFTTNDVKDDNISQKCTDLACDSTN